jgi:fructokinase
MSTNLYGAIEAGGTKFICGVGSGPNDIGDKVRIPTTTPQETLSACIDFFKNESKKKTLAGIGVSCFGPLDLNTNSPSYGSITKTPKAGWSDINVRKIIETALDIPVAIDTDVNGAAIAEHLWGAAQDVNNILYITIGTGIGGGMLVNGKPIHGLIHPEMGHFRPLRHPKDTFEGLCSFHKGCFEGLASGPAVKARWNGEPRNLPADHIAWEIESHYIAEALATFICILSPQRIIIGGGIMNRDFIFPMLRKKTLEKLNGYVVSNHLLKEIDSYIIPQGLEGDAGLLGGIALAKSLDIANQ